MKINILKGKTLMEGTYNDAFKKKVAEDFELKASNGLDKKTAFFNGAPAED